MEKARGLGLRGVVNGSEGVGMGCGTGVGREVLCAEDEANEAAAASLDNFRY